MEKLRKDKDLQFQGQKVILRPDLSPETIQERRLMRPLAQKLHQNCILFSWGYPAKILIFKDGKLLKAWNPFEAEKLLHRFKIDIQKVEEEEKEEQEEEEE